RWATFASSKADRLKLKERSGTTTDAQRSFCAAPSNSAKALFSWFLQYPRTTTSSARATTVPESSNARKSPRRRTQSSTTRCRSKIQTRHKSTVDLACCFLAGVAWVVLILGDVDFGWRSGLPLRLASPLKRL